MMIDFLSPAIDVVHRLPANFHELDNDDFLSERRYRTEKVRLVRHENATVTADSVVYQHGKLLPDSLPANAPKNYYYLRYPLKQWLRGRQVQLGVGQYLLATDIWSSGHFHWLCDVLPRLYCIREHASSFTLLLPDDPYIRQKGAESLELFGLAFADIIWMRPDHRYYLKNLHRITPIAPSGHMHPSIMQSIRNIFTSDIPVMRRRIYISRSSAAYRKILNETEILPVLASYGFEICYPEQMNFKEQIKLFAETQWLMGIHGAGLANICFMKEGGGLIEIRRKENGPTNVGYWHLSDALGLAYYYVNGEPDSDCSIVGRGCNLTIPAHILENILLSLFLYPAK